MTVVSNGFNKTITYWPPDEIDRFGQAAFGEPEELLGFIEASTGIFKTKEGKEITINSVAYLPQEVLVGGYLFEGESEAETPIGLNGAFQIMSFTKNYSIDGLSVLYSAKLYKKIV